MANFTSEIRRDLLGGIPKKECCRLAMLSALFTTSGSLPLRGEDAALVFTSEDERVAECVLAMIEQTFHVTMAVKEAVRDPKKGRDKLTFAYEGADAGAISAKIAAQKIVAPCCKEAYIKGAFLGGGSCTLPRVGVKTGYHLEFVFPQKRRADWFRDLLDGMQLLSGVVGRGDKFVVYLKSREAISDFLSVAGAKSALRTFEEVSAEREENNNANRVSNCYAGNLDKSAIASAAQVMALTALEGRGVLDALPDALKRTAKARMENPTLSLGELAQKLGVSKSCLNHRMRKLLQIYGGRMP